MILGGLFEIGLDHLPSLVDLHREDRQMIAVVVELLHCLLEGVVHLPNLTGKDLGEAEQQGKLDAFGEQVVDQSLDVDKAGVPIGGPRDEMSLRIDGKVSGAPILDAVCLRDLSNG